MSRTGFIQNELDLKLLVLYIMTRAAAPITFLQLLDLALCDAGVDYFSLTEAVNHLVETEHLTQEGDLYTITDKGRRNSEICESSLPYSVRMRCDENLVRLNDVLKRAALVQTDLKPNEDGTCTVRLFFSDDSGPLMDLKLLSPSLRQGQLLSARFHDKMCIRDRGTIGPEETQEVFPMSETFGPDFITVTDEDGNEFELELVDTLEHNGITYRCV